MAGTKGSESVRSLMYPGKSALLPPKIPFPSVSASYSDYVPCGLMGSSRQGHKVSIEKAHHHHHQRTSSESHLVEELPFWLDDLLNEPETPASRKSGHRRSASDSYAYLDVSNATNLTDFSSRNQVSSIQRGIQESQDASFYADSSFLKQRSRQLVPSGPPLPSWLPSTGASYMSQDATADYAEAQPVTYEADNNTKRAKQYVTSSLLLICDLLCPVVRDE